MSRAWSVLIAELLFEMVSQMAGDWHPVSRNSPGLADCFLERVEFTRSDHWHFNPSSIISSKLILRDLLGEAVLVAELSPIKSAFLPIGSRSACGVLTVSYCPALRIIVISAALSRRSRSGATN